MFKLDLRTILMFLIIAVVGWTQWKIYTQEQTISDLNTSLEKSQTSVSNLTLEVKELREQMRIDKEAVAGWFEKAKELHTVQQGYQTEVKDVLAKFQYELAFNAKTPDATKTEGAQPQVPSYRIGDHIAVPALNGMWNAFTTTRSAAGLTQPGTDAVPEKGTHRSTP